MNKIIKDLKSFENVFSQSFYRKVTEETLIPTNMTKQQFQSILTELYNDVISDNYFPSNLRGRIFKYKSNNVARVISCLSVKDEALYFFLLKLLEEDIAKNKTPGTFGGWRLGNTIKELEDLEIEYVTNSYDPRLWNENWIEFTDIIWDKIYANEYDVAYSLDIANFYDNINLSILEKKLLSVVEKNKSQIVSLLMFFLKNWNKSTVDSDYKTVGIPQSEFGDQSRLLANFYLQDYDSIISEICLSEGADYVRYADDQIIFAKKDVNINKIMLNICDELNKIGLNVNANKVHEFKMEELETYYGYEIIGDIFEKRYNMAAKKFFDLKRRNVKFREDILLKKLLTSDLNNYSKKDRTKILQMVMQDEFLLKNGYFYIKKVFTSLSGEQLQFFIDKLNYLLKTTYYNRFHYSVLKFATEFNLSELKKIAEERIIELDI